MAGTAFVALAATAVVGAALPADAALREAILTLASPWVIEAMRVINRAGDWRVLLPGTLLLFVIFPEARRRWWLWTALMVTAPITEWALKHLVGRPRPEDVSLGFPSGHSTAAAAFFGAVVFLAGALPPRLCRAARVVSVVTIVLVGLARVMLRAHWPSDALGGIALGLTLAAIAGLVASTASVTSASN